MSNDRDFPADALRVAITTESYCYHSYHSGEQWGDWSESHSFSVIGARVVDENHKDYSCEYFRVPAGTTSVYVLSMVYSTGDSFGRSDGNGAVLGCFGNRDVALAAEAAVKANEDDYTIKVKDDFGREISIYNPGSGYFESVDSIDLRVFVI